MASAEQSVGILIVDDEQAILDSLSRLLSWRLRSLGTVTIYTAIGIDAARAHLERRPIDLVLADHRFPETRTGADLLAVVKERWPRARRILMSGYLDIAEAGPHASAVAERFITKPWDANALAQDIAALVRSSKAA